MQVSSSRQPGRISVHARQNDAECLRTPASPPAGASCHALHSDAFDRQHYRRAICLDITKRVGPPSAGVTQIEVPDRLCKGAMYLSPPRWRCRPLWRRWGCTCASGSEERQMPVGCGFANGRAKGCTDGAPGDRPRQEACPPAPAFPAGDNQERRHDKFVLSDRVRCARPRARSGPKHDRGWFLLPRLPPLIGKLVSRPATVFTEAPWQTGMQDCSRIVVARNREA